jgi:hypothetical protein
MRFKAMGKATTLAALPALALLAALALPPQATAARVAAPPGNSEADQYFETLPAAAGPRSPNEAGTTQGAVREGRLSAAAARALEGSGGAGLGVARVVARTAPARRPTGAGGSVAGAAAEGARVPGRQGLGAFFPAFLAVAAAAAAAFAFLRRRPAVR